LLLGKAIGIESRDVTQPSGAPYHFLRSGPLGFKVTFVIVEPPVPVGTPSLVSRSSHLIGTPLHWMKFRTTASSCKQATC